MHKGIFSISFIIIIFYLLSGTSSFAQSGNPPKISGKIIGKGGEAQGYVSFVLLKNSSEQVKSGLTDSLGNFFIANVPDGEYSIKFSQMGYEQKIYSPISLNKGSNFKNIGIIELKESLKSLNEVAIVGRKQLIEHSDDKMTINVGSSITSTGSTALEVLGKSPGVIVDQNGSIKLRGKEGVLIMIDDKATYLSSTDLANLLRSMSSSKIDKIEIMTNPSAKYDAAGKGGIINIKLKKGSMEGFSGTSLVSYRQGKYASENFDLALNYNKKKLSVFVNYNVMHSKGLDRLGIIRLFPKEDQLFDQTNTKVMPSTSQSFGAGLSYALNKKTSIGGSVNSVFSNTTQNGEGLTNISSISTRKLLSQSFATNDVKSKLKNISANLNIKHVFDTAGTKATFDIDYSGFNQKRNQQFVTNYVSNVDPVDNYFSGTQGELPIDIKVIAAKVDFNKRIFNKIEMEVGAKFSNVRTDNNMKFMADENSNDAMLPNNSNRFKYEENITAGYVNFKENFGRFSVQAGLRGEKTNGTGRQVIPSDSVFKKSYFKLFPSLFLSQKLSATQSLSFVYSYRIDRPAYRYLNPFKYFIDQYTYDAGNPDLNPEFTNSFELSHNFKGLRTSIDYSHTSGAMTKVLNQNDSTKILYQIMDNLASRTSYGLTVIKSFQVNRIWTTTNYLNFNNKKFSGKYLGTELNRSQSTFTINSTNTFSLPDGWAAELSGWFMTKSLYEIYVLDPIGSLSVGVQKQLFNKKATLKINVSDILKTNKSTVYLDIANINSTINNSSDSRFVSMTFSYRFGNINRKSKSRQESSANDELKRIKLTN
ncbi:TonB-dependent receptor [Pedobacter sp. PAMC26386]|nr:TonB-dependent receptor [Pedobacter sp. PAMC26386]